MFAPDTSTLIAFLSGDSSSDTELFKKALANNLAVMLPPVLSEILSDRNLPKKHEEILLSLPRAATQEDFWLRAGYLRRQLLSKKFKARLADSLITQICIDSSITLITRDADFKSFARYSELQVKY